MELAEGPWLHARLDGVDRAALREGLPLRAVFAHPDEGEPYLLFRHWTE
ncbi:OB-fold domain-containing protein [Actinomadura sp. CNU-125]|nr:OB-fold domain-containing protein [Actinomadura sp. CNU-125]